MGWHVDHLDGIELCGKCGIKRVEEVKNGKRKKPTAATGTGQSDISGVKSNNVKNDNYGNIILFENLASMADKKLEHHTEKLKRKIDKLSKNTAWNEMIKYEQAMGDRVQQSGTINLRQDNGDYVTYPNKLGFDVKKLDELKLKDFYDSRVYLSNLMLVANAVNDKFHDTLKNDILKKDFSVDYQRGPLKKIERCQSKAETDYSLKPYPNSAQLLDIVRCMLVYQRPEDLMAGIKVVVDRVKKGDTCLKRVLRVKNMFIGLFCCWCNIGKFCVAMLLCFFCFFFFFLWFIENKKEAAQHLGKSMKHLKKDDYLYTYADLKLNILLDWQAMSMICEVFI